MDETNPHSERPQPRDHLRRSSSTDEPLISQKLHTPRRRSMTSLTENGSISMTPHPLLTSTSTSTGYPLSAIKYAPDGTKLAPNGGKLFRGGSNNIPRFDAPLSTNETFNKENEVTLTASLTQTLYPGALSESPSRPLSSEDPSSVSKKKRRIGADQSNENLISQLALFEGGQHSTNQPQQAPPYDTDIGFKRRRLSC
jgi:hypothetical protein